MPRSAGETARTSPLLPADASGIDLGTPVVEAIGCEAKSRDSLGATKVPIEVGNSNDAVRQASTDVAHPYETKTHNIKER